MKKIIFSLVIALFMLSFATKVYSCPDNTWSTSSKTITIGGCDYNVTICYKCAVGIDPLMYVQITEFNLSDHSLK